MSVRHKCDIGCDAGGILSSLGPSLGFSTLLAPAQPWAHIESLQRRASNAQVTGNPYRFTAQLFHTYTLLWGPFRRCRRVIMVYPEIRTLNI
jgi:hypothetical protein